MSSPFPPSSSVPGKGHLVVGLQPYGISALSKLAFQYPLKLISPSPSAEQKSLLVFLLTYGGGLVGGDQVHLTIDVKDGSKLSIVTQGHTKIFKSASRQVVTRQTVRVTLEVGAAVCVLPDPVQPFKGSVYEQKQVFMMADRSSLCLLDWVSAGRTARGENWDCCAWSGQNEVWTATLPNEKARLLLRDNVMLEGDSGDAHDMPLKTRMHLFGIFGTLVLRGPLIESLAAFFLAEFSSLPRIGSRDFRSQEKVNRDKNVLMTPQQTWRNVRLQQESEGRVLWSAANVRGCTVIKFGAHTVEGGRKWIGSMIRQEGSITQQFGEDCLMCIRI
jgi:urease accessory protein